MPRSNQAHVLNRLVEGSTVTNLIQSSTKDQRDRIDAFCQGRPSVVRLHRFLGSLFNTTLPVYEVEEFYQTLFPKGTDAETLSVEAQLARGIDPREALELSLATLIQGLNEARTQLADLPIGETECEGRRNKLYTSINSFSDRIEKISKTLNGLQVIGDQNELILAGADLALRAITNAAKDDGHEDYVDLLVKAATAVVFEEVS